MLARVFITPMPVLRLLERLGVTRELKLLQEAVATMRASLLGVIHVRAHQILQEAVWCVRKGTVCVRLMLGLATLFVGVLTQHEGPNMKSALDSSLQESPTSQFIMCACLRASGREGVVGRRSGGRRWRRAQRAARTCWACCWMRATRRGSP